MKDTIYITPGVDPEFAQEKSAEDKDESLQQPTTKGPYQTRKESHFGLMLIIF